MSVTKVTCLVIKCDTCQAVGGIDDAPAHFESLDEATTFLGGPEERDWLMASAEHTCPDCRARRACATVGHEWSLWRSVDARGIPMMWRWCYRCEEHEQAPSIKVGGQ